MSFSAESEAREENMMDIVSTNRVKRLPTFLQMIQLVCMLNIFRFLSTMYSL